MVFWLKIQKRKFPVLNCRENFGQLLTESLNYAGSMRLQFITNGLQQSHRTVNEGGDQQTVRIHIVDTEFEENIGKLYKAELELIMLVKNLEMRPQLQILPFYHINNTIQLPPSCVIYLFIICLRTPWLNGQNVCAGARGHGFDFTGKRGGSIRSLMQVCY